MNTPSNKNLSIKAIAIITLIPLFSFVFLLSGDDGMIIGAPTIKGVLALVMLILNVIGINLLYYILYLFYGPQSQPLTLTLWTSAIFINWAAIFLIYYLVAWYLKNTNPAVKKVGRILFWIYIIASAFIFVIERFKTWLQ